MTGSVEGEGMGLQGWMAGCRTTKKKALLGESGVMFRWSYYVWWIINPSKVYISFLIFVYILPCYVSYRSNM